jgi:hypothetical protein
MPFVRISSILPPLRCQEWTERHFSVSSKNSARLLEIAKKAGTTSDAFNNSVNKFQYYAKFETVEKIIREITKPVHVRAVIHLLLNDATFRNKVTLSEYLLNALEKPLGRLSNLALMALVRLWFEQFDRLGPEKILNYFGQFLLNRLKVKTENPRCSHEFQNLYKYRSLIFQKDGPTKLVDAIPKNKTLEVFFNKPGLQGYENGRFQHICRTLYYIETLNKIPVGTYHSVLEEIKKQEVYGAPYKDKLLIGHKILSILIDRSPDESISDSWQNTVLAIAGDPRVPKASPRYQKWWAFMSQAQIAKMVGWLSKVDLKLFLEALEEYGRSSGKEDLQRIFPPENNSSKDSCVRVWLKNLDYLSETKLIHFFARCINAKICLHMPEFVTHTDRYSIFMSATVISSKEATRLSFGYFQIARQCIHIQLRPSRIHSSGTFIRLG